LAVSSKDNIVFLNNLKQEIAPDKFNLISPYGYGDIMALCGFKEAIEDFYKAKVNFIIKQQHEIVMKLFNISDYSIKAFTEDELEQIADKNPTMQIGKYFVAHPYFLDDNHKLLNSFADLKIDFIKLFQKTIALPDYSVWKEPKNTPYITPSLEQKLSKIAPLEKIILFSPEAFSTKKINRRVLELEVERLFEKGFTVISSVLDKKEAIKGTVYLDLSMEESLAIGINCAGVYAVRSGFVDLILNYIDKMTVFYPDTETYSLYSLKKIPGKNIEEIIATGSQVDKIGPFFQIETKSNQKMYRFCFTALRVKEKREYIKYSMLGIPVWLIRKEPNSRKHYLFACICVYKEGNK